MPVETQLEAIMDQMHEAILAADFRRISELSPLLEAELSTLHPTADTALLERLRRKADRNATCAKAAARGVRAAIRRLAEVRENATGLITYTEGGARLERRNQGEMSRRF